MSQKKAKVRKQLPAAAPGDVLTISEVAMRLRIAKLTAYRMARDGRLPTIRAGRRFLVPKIAFEKLLVGAVAA